MKHEIPHDLSLDLAKRATERAFAGYAERFSDYNPQANWVTDTKSEISFSAKGITLDGAIELKPRVIELELDVPFWARPFRKKAISIIEEEIQDWIVRAKNGELDEEGDA